MKIRFLLCCGGALLAALGADTLSAQQQSNQPPAKAEEPRKKRVVADLAGFELEDPGKARAENTKLGATRGELRPELLAPLRAKLYGGSALFAWSYAGKASRFAVIFTDDADNEVFRGEANGKEYRLPQTSYKFRPEMVYSWSVATQPPLIGAGPSKPAQVVVVSEKERAQIENALAAIPKGDEYRAGLACAKIFTDHRLWFDAVGAYTELIAKFPGHAELYEQRGAIYAQLDATKALAETDFARAEQVQTGQGSKN